MDTRDVNTVNSISKAGTSHPSSSSKTVDTRGRGEQIVNYLNCNSIRECTNVYSNNNSSSNVMEHVSTSSNTLVLPVTQGTNTIASNEPYRCHASGHTY